MKRFYLMWLLAILLMPVMLLGADGGLWTWIKESWMLIVGLLAFLGGGFYVPFIRTLLFHALKAAISGPVLKRLALEALKKYAKSTTTQVDDEWVKEFERRTRKVKSI